MQNLSVQGKWNETKSVDKGGARREKNIVSPYQTHSVHQCNWGTLEPESERSPSPAERRGGGEKVVISPRVRRKNKKGDESHHPQTIINRRGNRNPRRIDLLKISGKRC